MAEPLRASEASARAPAPAAALFAVRAGPGRYAFDPVLVEEVVRLGPLTRLPVAPSFLPGVFAHRGRVLAVLDLSQLLGQPPVVVGPGTRAVLVRAGPFEVALIADAVLGPCTVDAGDAAPASVPGEGGPEVAFLSAVARDERGPLSVLDLPRLVEAARGRSLPR